MCAVIQSEISSMKPELRSCFNRMNSIINDIIESTDFEVVDQYNYVMPEIEGLIFTGAIEYLDSSGQIIGNMKYG